MVTTIVDYGMGNIGSLENMVRKVGGNSVIATTPEEVSRADKIILPGVGHFDNAISRLKKLGLWDALDEKARSGIIPFLCICLGAQLVTEASEEGTSPGFGWIPGRTVKFSFGPNASLRIPHMGWNDVKVMKPSALLSELPEDPCFYFVHSYYMQPYSDDDVLTMTTYGIEFASGLSRGNITALQFHPEKSHKYGMAVIRKFVEMPPC